MLVGLGAVSTTTIAGVIAIRRGLAKPIGSLTQMGTVRLGKRTEANSPQIKDFVPLASLDDIVFGGWDLFDENCYEAAKTAGVLEQDLLDQIRPELEADPAVARRVRSALRQAARRAQRQEGQEQARPRRPGARRHPEIQEGQRPQPPGHGLVRQHRGLPHRIARARDHRGVREGARGERRQHPVEHDLRLRRDQGRHPVRQRGAEPERRRPGADPARAADRLADVRQGSEDRADADQDDHRARPEGAADRRRRLVLDQHPRQPRRRSARRSRVVQDEGREQEVGARLHHAAERSIPICTRTSVTSSASTTTRRAATTKRAGTTSTSSAGLATRCS